MIFREGPIEAAVANRFAQHVGIALDAVERIDALSRNVQIISMQGGEGLAQDHMDRWVYEWSKGWQDAWDQLGEARAIVAAAGRDIGAFDEARAAAGDIYVNAASGSAVRVGRTVHISWRNNSTDPARRAVAALQVQMPEVVVTRPDPPPLPELPDPETARAQSGPPWQVTLIIVAVLVAIIYFTAT